VGEIEPSILLGGGAKDAVESARLCRTTVAFSSGAWLSWSVTMPVTMPSGVAWARTHPG